MRSSRKSCWTGLVLVSSLAVLLQGCAVAAVATVAAGGGVGYGFSEGRPATTASAAPASGDETRSTAQPAAESEAPASGEPVVLYQQQAPVEPVEVETLQ